MRRRWLAASVAAGFLVAAGLLASLILVLLPDPPTTATHSGATPAVDARLSGAFAPGPPPGASPARPGPAPGITPGVGAAPGPAATTPAATGTKSSTATRTKSSAATPGPASLAGRIRPGVTYRGVATSYDADGGGNCSYDPGKDHMVAAMNHTDYESSKACGAYVLVRSTGGSSVTVRITDQCPGCAAGQLDLSREAFARLAAPSAGRIRITWKLLSPDLDRTIAVRYKTGSSRHWCAIQVIDHRNPLARLDIRGTSSWRRLSRSTDNYFVSPNGTGCGGAIRVTDIYGEHLTLSGISVKPGVTQATLLQFTRH